jgi:hypothetical protein
MLAVEHDRVRLRGLVPLLRPEALTAQVPGCPSTCRPRVEALLADVPVRRVPITLGSDVADPGNDQHGTDVWKYMTQNTFRSS